MKPQIPFFMRAIRALVVLSILGQCVSAQPGTLDPTFAQDGQFIQDFGAQDNLTKVRVRQADQKIVAVGTALTPAFAGQLLVMRFLPDGTPDPDFSDDGVVLITDFNESYAYDLYFQADGKTVVAGTRADADYQFSMLVIRLNDDGSLDPTFGTNGFSEPEVSVGEDIAYSVVPLEDGRMLLAGTARDSEERNQPVVVRLNEDGTMDDTFGTDGIATVPITGIDNKFWNLAQQSDGSIVASGHLDMGLTVSGQFNFDVLVARFTSEGTLDGTFGTDGVVTKAISDELVESAFGMAMDGSDKIILCGYTTNVDFSYDAYLMELDPDGGVESAFGSDGLVIFDHAVQDAFTGMVLQPDGKILVCGISGGFFFDPHDQLVARFGTDGSLDGSFGTSGFTLMNAMGYFDEANAITLQGDAKILVAGKANNGNQNDIAVTRLRADVGAMVPDVAGSATFQLSPNPAVRGGQVLVVPGKATSGAVPVRLFDAIGNEVAIGLGSVSDARRAILLPLDLAPGLYTVSLGSSRDGIGTARLIVQD